MQLGQWQPWGWVVSEMAYQTALLVGKGKGAGDGTALERAQPLLL